ncbi:hypothetical protein CMO83_00715 [Candidatus Woesearchaeota archaeon]|jgi:ferredoxin-NADP reductase|nr:hypothetical protein [Candidatus Woesearchaeota archaeon]|tara:strand:- start:42630 stop:43337 length:708 start_codon:yes stop_codon:yes gene_type:complete
MVLNLELNVVEIKQETPDVKSFKLDLGMQTVDYKPGQYFMVELDIESDEKIKPLSIASSPTEEFILICTKSGESDFKHKLDSLKVGDKIKVKGPMGIFVLKEDAKEIMFLSGGIGVTPFRNMIKYASDNKLPIKMTLLYSNKTPADIVFEDQWHSFEKENPNLKVIHTITNAEGDDWQGRKGRIDEKMIKENCSDINNAVFYICGPPGMVDGLTNLLKSMNVPQQNIKIEKFEGY